MTPPITTTHAIELLYALRTELYRLARREDSLADEECARVPYWAPCPASVLGHRAAARALEAEAAALLEAC
jgi:hypothetical protein